MVSMKRLRRDVGYQILPAWPNLPLRIINQLLRVLMSITSAFYPIGIAGARF